MRHKSVLFGSLVAAAVFSSSSASAVTFTTTGNTTGGPTFNRPLTATGTPSGTSGVGTAVPYSALSFTVDLTGSYAFVLTSLTTAYDPFLVLYSPTFIAASPLTNGVRANDDLATGNLTQSGFTQALTAGTSYVAVATGFDNLDFGAFSLTIDGPGTVTPAGATVPEPASWAMMVGGFGLIGGAMRRRKVAVSFA